MAASSLSRRMDALLHPVSEHFIALSLLAYAFGMASHAVAAVVDGNAFALAGNKFNVVPYYVDYFRFGFVKRGLAGTLLAPLFRELTGDIAWGCIAAHAINFGIFVAGLFVVDRVTVPQTPACRAVRAILVLSPLGIAQWGYDHSRLDHLALVVLAFAFAALHKRNWVALGMLSAVGVLVHEAFAVFALPAMAAAAFKDSAGMKAPLRAWALLKVVALPLVACVAVTVAGNMDPQQLARVPDFLRLPGYLEPWERGVFDPNRELAPWENVVVCLYLAAPYACLAGFYRSNSLRLDFPAALSASALLLLPLGGDWSRWTQLALVSTSIPIAYHCFKGEQLWSWTSNPVTTVAGAVLLVPLGPIGIGHPLPYLQPLLSRLFA